jgi:gliding motility-associated-like protein
MKRKLLQLFVCCAGIAIASAQNDQTWYFGNRAGLDFSGGTPVPLMNSMLNADEGTAVMCTAAGNLLFYTNGIVVLNKNHGIMENGSGLFGGMSSTQSALIVQKPGSADRYYIFTAAEFTGANGICYSEVDMAANGGLGSVVLKNVPLMAPSCEKVAAVMHSNGTDVWIVSHKWGSDAFYCWLLTGSGITTAPVISTTGSTISGSDLSRSFGYLKIAPDARHIVIANTSFDAQLLDFNSTTGSLSNPVTLLEGSPYGVEFSATGNVLYITEFGNVLQFDMTAPDIPATKTTVKAFDTNLGSLLLGPDSKIYVTSFATDKLSVINNPDVLGTGCNVNANTIGLGGRVTKWGLPTFFQSGFYVTAINGGNDCSGNEISFSVASTLTPDTFSWDFGDGTFSTAANPAHAYTAAGTYMVKVSAKKAGYQRYFSTMVTILPAPEVNEPLPMITCDDSSGDGQEVFNLQSQDAQILGTLPAAQYIVSYHATPEDAEANSNILPLAFTNTINLQTVYARVTPLAGGCYAVTSFTLTVIPLPEIDMPDSYTACEGTTVTLTAPAGFDGYLWSTGETTRHIEAEAAGDYTVTVFKENEGVVCDASKVVTVLKSAKPEIIDIAIKDWTENDNSITVTTGGAGDYEYSKDGVAWQESPVFTGLEPGKYTVYVKDKKGCGMAVQEVVLLMYPRYFTPNGDGHHETWRIQYAHFEPDMLIHIFDRYGKLLSSFTGSGPGWDGRYNGASLPGTDYWFVAIRSDGREYKGHFSMLR